MIRVRQVLEQSQKISNALHFIRDLRVVQLLGPRCHWRQAPVWIRLCLLAAVHFSQLVHQFLDQRYVETLSK